MSGGGERRVLVTGAGGQVGKRLVPAFEAFGWDVIGLTRAELDVADEGAVLATVGELLPTVVVNAAACNAVDAAEADDTEAVAVNATAVGHLVDVCREVGARLCHMSTDYVFDGTKDGPYVESDTPNPQSAYGRSKVAGERELRADDLLVRTSWVFSADVGNTVQTIARLAADPDRELVFVTDQVGCPTDATDLAAAIAMLVDGGHAGTFHLTNAGPVSWYELAREVLELTGHDPARVRPVATADLVPARPAPRPANSVLDGLALRLCGLPPLRHHRVALAEVLRGDEQQQADERDHDRS